MEREEMKMIKTIYSRAIAVLVKKPFRLWGISLLSGVITGCFSLLFGIVPGISLALGVLVSVGMTMVFLHGYRGEQVEATQLFDAFKDGATIKRTIGGMAWMYLWVFLWGLIPIVGFVFAIIKTYQYRLTPYILVQEPEVAPTEAIKVSKERTKGYVGSMFLADLLPGLAVGLVVLVLSLFMLIPVGFIRGLFGFLIVVVLIVCALFLGLFLGLVQAAFYEEISNPTMTVTGEETMHCPNCGALITKGAAFCPNCGAKIEE